jgi:hypothetical protein
LSGREDVIGPKRTASRRREEGAGLRGEVMAVMLEPFSGRSSEYSEAEERESECKEEEE